MLEGYPPDRAGEEKPARSMLFFEVGAIPLWLPCGTSMVTKPKVTTRDIHGAATGQSPCGCPYPPSVSIRVHLRFKNPAGRSPDRPYRTTRRMRMLSIDTAA